MNTVFMFPGMGSQFPHMGRDLYLGEVGFRQRVDELVRLCRDVCGREVLASLRGGAAASALAAGTIADTALSIFIIEHALADTLIRAGVEPDLLLGCSLGMFAASSVSGMLPVEAALAAVAAQADVFERHSGDGAMLAVLTPHRHLLDDVVACGWAEIAATNFASSHVLSMPADRLGLVEERLQRANVSSQRIEVTRAFHSRWIDSARAPFLGRLGGLDYRRARAPVMCCSREHVSMSLSAAHLWAAVRQPIGFQSAIERVEQAGPWRYVDVGPSGSLATSLKYLLPATSASTPRPVMTLFGGDLPRWRDLVTQQAA